MEKQKIEPGDLVQLNPNLVGNKAFAGCIMVVTELKEWGAQGYVQSLGEMRDIQGGQAFYRAHWPEIEYVGRAIWMIQ